jgi:hypothetical protein
LKNWIFIFVIFTCSLAAQDTIRFTDEKVSAVKVSEVGLTEIKYNRFDNLTGPVYVVEKNLVRYIKYANGSVDSFNVSKPKTEMPKVETPQTETPAYVNNTVTPSFQRIQIVGKKKLFYDHHPLNDKALFMVIKKHPEQGVQNLMMKEFAKVSIYKSNRNIGLFMLYGGMAAALFSGAAGNTGVVPVFLLGSAASITGGILAVMNKNKRYAARMKIAKLYNGDFINVK